MLEGSKSLSEVLAIHQRISPELEQSPVVSSLVLTNIAGQRMVHVICLYTSEAPNAQRVRDTALIVSQEGVEVRFRPEPTLRLKNSKITE